MKTINIYVAFLILSISTNVVCQRTTPQIAAKTENYEVLPGSGGTPKSQSQQNQQMMKKVEINLKKYETEMQKKQLADNSLTENTNTKSENPANTILENIDNITEAKTKANESSSAKSDSKSLTNENTNVKPMAKESPLENSEENSSILPLKKPNMSRVNKKIAVKIKKTVDCAKLMKWVLVDENLQILMQKSLKDQEVSIFNTNNHKNLNITYSISSLSSQPKYVLLKWEDSQCAIENPSPNRARIIPTDMWDIEAQDFVK